MQAVLRRLALLLLLGLAACGPRQAPLMLATDGGEAWTFEKLVEGTVAEGACDEVAVSSPAGTVTAVPQGERLIARVPLAPGANIVQADCLSDGASKGRPAQQSWDVRLADAPKAWVRTVREGDGIALDGGASELAPVRSAPIVSYEWRARAGNPAPLAGLPAQGERILLPRPAVDGEYYVTLRVADALGRADSSTAVFRVRGGRIEEVDLARENPAWVDQAVVYGIVPFFFGPRGFDDVTARLDELADLGVTTLWLSPITAAAEDDFGYAVTDPFRLRPTFGSEQDLRELVQSAHARGLRVIMDFVPNHLSAESAYFADAEARRRRSPYFDFFEREPNGQAEYYFDWPHLPNLNYDNPEVQRLEIEAFARWVRDFDVDGFRVDVAWGPRQRAPEFWPRWRRELKRIKPDLLLLAEASARDPYYFRNGFDAAYDWTDQLGVWAWRDAFEDEAHTASRLRAAIANDGTGYDPDALIFRFLNNNDTGPRFVTRYGPARTRVAAAMLLTLPGIPGLYTGDEVGAAFEPYDEGPPIAWTDRQGLEAWYERLIDLRSAQPALRSRELRFLDVGPADQVLAYLRPAARAEDSVLVLLNYGPERQRVVVADDALAPGTSAGRLIDVMTGERLGPANRRPGIELPGYGVRILKLD